MDIAKIMNIEDLIEEMLDHPSAYEMVSRVNQALKIEKENRLKFREWLKDDVKAEFINGEIVMHSPVKRRHLKVTRNLHPLMQMYAVYKDLGEVSMALRTNIEVDRKVGIIKIHNQPYIEEVLDRFGYTDCNPANTPADPNPNNALSKDDWDKEPDKCADLPFRPLLGCLWWVCVMK